MRIAAFCLAAFPLLADDKLLTAPPNAPEHRTKPYVLLIGLDGYRHDYAEKFEARNILGFRDGGSSAAGLIPSFPSTTSPNFYTLVTGVRPDKHEKNGIVAMSFFDPAWNELFLYRSKNATEAKWFEQATPIWNAVEQAGMRTASLFWVGTEAAIHGKRPTAWTAYDSSTTEEARVNKVLDWLRLPEANRPHFITLYFSSIDTVAHRTVPDSPEVRKAVLDVDRTLGNLFRGLAGIQPEVNVVIVSDHGMATMNRIVDLTSHADFSGVTVVNQLTMISLYSKDQQRLRTIENSLRGRSADYRVYRRTQLPKHLHYRINLRVGDLLILTTGTHGVLVRTTSETPSRRLPSGQHGYDPQAVTDMRGIFYAAGPNLKPGIRLGHVENTQIFGLIAALLKIPVPPGADSGRQLARKLVR